MHNGGGHFVIWPKTFIPDIMQNGKYSNTGLTKKELEIKHWKLGRFNKMREAYLSYIVQHIRTQMNDMTGFSKLLAEEDTSREKKISYYDQIEQSSEELDKLINESLSVATMSLDDIDIKSEPCFVNQMTDELYSYFSQQKKLYSKAYVELYLDQNVEDENFAILTDCSRLRQILAQLIGNSLSHCSDGDEIEFGYRLINEGNSGIFFYVEDNATEYSKEDVDELLKQPEHYMESKVDDLRMESVDFMVLQTLIDMLDGEISIITKNQKGIRYEIILPYHEHQKQEEDLEFPDDSSVKQVEELKEAFDWENKKIMIAEDVESNYTLLAEALEGTKAELIHAKDGKQAVELFEQDPGIDIILMDIKMPVVDGLEATKKIRGMNPDVPIIAQTAFVVDFEKKDAINAGCDDYVSKPLNFGKVFKLMDLYLKHLA